MGSRDDRVRAAESFARAERDNGADTTMIAEADGVRSVLVPGLNGDYRARFLWDADGCLSVMLSCKADGGAPWAPEPFLVSRGEAWLAGVSPEGFGVLAAMLLRGWRAGLWDACRHDGASAPPHEACTVSVKVKPDLSDLRALLDEVAAVIDRHGERGA